MENQTCQSGIFYFKGQKALRVFYLVKLQEKLNAHFSTIKILANDPQLLESVQPSMSFNVVHGLKMRGN